MHPFLEIRQVLDIETIHQHLQNINLDLLSKHLRFVE